jgi:hypothetical protein
VFVESHTELRDRVVSIPASYSLKISVRRPAFLTYALRGFCLYLQANVGIVTQIRPGPLPSTSFPIYLLLIFLSLTVIV